MLEENSREMGNRIMGMDWYRIRRVVGVGAITEHYDPRYACVHVIIRKI